MFDHRHLILMLAFLLAGCAASVKFAPARDFLPDPDAAKTELSTLQNGLEIHLDTAYTRTLKPGSQWLRVGRLGQAEVFRPYKDIFTLEGEHVHEAYLVIDNGHLVGFYLPVERGFSSLSRKLPIVLK